MVEVDVVVDVVVDVEVDVEVAVEEICRGGGNEEITRIARITMVA